MAMLRQAQDGMAAHVAGYSIVRPFGFVCTRFWLTSTSWLSLEVVVMEVTHGQA
jgi:hypothetical protein